MRLFSCQKHSLLSLWMWGSSIFSQELEVQIRRHCIVFGPLGTMCQERFSDHFKGDTFKKNGKEALKSRGSPDSNSGWIWWKEFGYQCSGPLSTLRRILNGCLEFCRALSLGIGLPLLHYLLSNCLVAANGRWGTSVVLVTEFQCRHYQFNCYSRQVRSHDYCNYRTGKILALSLLPGWKYMCLKEIEKCVFGERVLPILASLKLPTRQ